MSWLPSARRSFLSQVGSGISAAFAGTLVGGAATLQAQSTGRGRPQPTRHAQDDWFDQLPGRHRLLLDTTTANGLGNALLYANNFLNSSQTGYGLKDSDSAVVIVVRHFATVFAYNDAIWTKYGVTMSQRINFTDPQTQQPAKINVYNSASHGAALPSLGNTLDARLSAECILPCASWPLGSFPVGSRKRPAEPPTLCTTKSSATWSPTPTSCRQGSWQSTEGKNADIPSRRWVSDWEGSRARGVSARRTS
jgi:hypothetical protein